MLETPALYAALPTVEVDGEESPMLSTSVLSAMTEETRDGLYRCEVVFGNWGPVRGDLGYVYSDRSMLDFGAGFAVRMGEGDKAATVFAGSITGIEEHYPRDRAPELVVLAEDRLQDLRMTRRTRTFEDVSDEDVIGQLASEHGLQSDIDIDGPTYRTLAQLNQSDLAFIRARARAVDAEVWVDGSRLSVQARARRTDGRVRLRYGSNLHEVSILADLAHQRTGVAVSGWDVAAKEPIQFEAGASAIQPEVDGPTTGPGVLEEAFGTRLEQIVHHVPLASAEAQALAEAEFRRRSRNFVTGSGVGEGDGRIRPGSVVELTGLAPPFNGDYHVCEVRHTYDGRQGYLTSFRIERPWLGAVS